MYFIVTCGGENDDES